LRGLYVLSLCVLINLNFISLKIFSKIGIVICCAIVLCSCGGDPARQALAARADSLFISVRCVRTVTSLISDNFLVPGQKKAQYRIEYINETWPDTITSAQALKLVNLKTLGLGFDKLVSATRSLQSLSEKQLEQLKKLNHEINNGAISNEDLLQSITFEGRCADTLNRVLDTLVKKSIELSCKSQSY
jgi:hypothetical protein